MKDNWKSKLKESKTRNYDFDTISGENLDVLYSPSNISNAFLNNINFARDFLFD